MYLEVGAPQALLEVGVGNQVVGARQVVHVDLAVFVDVVVVAAGDVLGGRCFEAELVAFTDQAQEANLDLCASDGRAGAVHNHERKAMRPRQHFVQGQEDTDLRVGFRRSARGNQPGQCRRTYGQRSQQRSS